MSQSSETNTLVNFILLARFRGHVAEEDLRTALTRLKGRHRAFDLRRAFDLHNPHAVFGGAFPLDVLCDTGEGWESVAARELARPFDPHGPRARFVLIQHYTADDLLIVCDHNGTDGLSGVMLLQDLLALLNNPALVLPALPVPPRLWDALPREVTQRFSNRLTAALMTTLFDIMGWFTHFRKTARPQSTFQINSAELSQDCTALLVERCRAHGVSVHAAVCTAWLMALSDQESRRPPHGSVSSPVSLRKYLPAEARGCAGMFYTTVVTRVDFSTARDFWNVACEVRDHMRQAESEPGFFTPPLMMDVMFKWMARQPDDGVFFVPDMPLNYDYSVTNLGRVICPYTAEETPTARYSISALYGPIVNAFNGEKTVGVCTLAGQLRFVFTTFADEVDRNRAADILHHAVDTLEAAARGV